MIVQKNGKKMQEHGFTISCAGLCSRTLTVSLRLLQGLILIPIASLDLRQRHHVEFQSPICLQCGFQFSIFQAFYILYLIPNHLTKVCHSSDGKGVIAKSHRTWVRIPSPLYICCILFIAVPVQIPTCGLPWTSDLQMPDGLQARSGGQE